MIIPVAPFDYTVFGATGDLTARKLLPALYHRLRDGQIPPSSRILASSRTDLSQDAYRQFAEQALRAHVAADALDSTMLARFLGMLSYARAEAAHEDGWHDIRAWLDARPEHVRAFYLATSPELFGPICANLTAHDLLGSRGRVVLEKPIGHDLRSAQAINDAVGRVVPEAQIFRIDHYLGKETVQNLLALRFANTIFERAWNADVIDHVQITVAETVGVEGRGAYYDKSGAMRDMVQNHLLQLLCLVAMESPISLDPDAVRDEKLKVLRSLRPIEAADIASLTVRGQYIEGAVNGRPVPAYARDLGISIPSLTETFAALKLTVDCPRWAGVPFYLRTGKRLPQKVSEIVVTYRQSPFSIFPQSAGERAPNRLVIRLQPQEGVKLEMMTKEPGPGGLHLRQTALDISFEETFGRRYPDAYERLLMDVVRGNTTLFMRRDEVEAAWRWADPVLAAWAQRGDVPKPYAAGTWGPTAAIALIARDGRVWHEAPLGECVR
jgi:glucose-6-phosphate 1-dehydrogenase